MEAAVIGAVVGDALGVPYEFSSREEMREDPAKGMRGFATHQQPPGTWSDDSSMLLCTAESLTGGFDTEDLARLYLRWFDEAYMTPHGTVFDYGITTNTAMARIRKGESVAQTGNTGEDSNGNGSLMRILPVALWFHRESQGQILKYAAKVSAITHAHPRSKLACGIYCLLIADLLTSVTLKFEVEDARVVLLQSLTDSKKQLPVLLRHTSMESELHHFDRLLDPGFGQLSEAEIESGGYVVHTLEASVWCILNTSSYQDAVLMAVNLGADTDTTACVTGGMAGLIYGDAGIPQNWIADLKSLALVRKIARNLAIAIENL